MSAPLLKHELMLKRCPNPRAIWITIGTVQALEWIIRNDCYYDSLARFLLREKRELPFETSVQILECYDFEEVFNHLNTFAP